jgi:hypothetical protein
MCGLHHQQSYPDDVEVAWWLAREHWGHGYATEAATGWLDHGFGTLHLPRVISMTDPPNLRSPVVMRRLGMVSDHEAEIEDMGMVFQAVAYAITDEQWRSAVQRLGRAGQPPQGRRQPNTQDPVRRPVARWRARSAGDARVTRRIIRVVERCATV